MTRAANAVAALVVAFAFALAIASPDTAAPQTLGPTVQLAPDVANLGDRVLVTGSGWPARSLVLIELCGNRAIDESADCAEAASVSAGVGATGTFSYTLPMTRPPDNCPCVVRVSTASALAPVTIPIRVIGVPVTPVQSHALDPGILLVVDSARLQGSGPWTSWFGGGAERTLVLTMHSIAPFVLVSPHLTIASGKAGEQATTYVLSPTLASFRPGEHRIVRIPVRLDAFSWGPYKVQGYAVGFGAQTQFTARTNVYWWGWPVVAFIIFNIILWRVLRRRARRDEERRIAAARASAVAPEPALVGAETAPGAEATGPHDESDPPVPMQ